MKTFHIPWAVTALVAIYVSGCQKNISDSQPGTTNDQVSALHEAASFPVGVGVDYDSLMANGIYTATVLSQFNSATAGYTMKHGAIVQNNGSYNFSKADALVSKVTAAGMSVYGHTLCWHANNNGNYLRSLLEIPGSTPNNPNLVLNGTFENGTGNSFVNWGVWNGASFVTAGTAAGEMYEGSRSLRVQPTAGGNPWNVQIASDVITMTSGVNYKVRFYAKAASAGGKFRLSNNGGTAQYSADYFPSTSWAVYEWTFNSNSTGKRILFDMGYTANTYYIDSVSVTLANPPASSASFAERQKRIDTTLKNFITNMVNRYKGSVHAWDVANEVLDENGILRTGVSSSDIFYFSDYMGDRNAAGATALSNGDSLLSKVFRYAHEADPTAKLFLNDYGHESNPRKMDSLIALVKRLKAQDVPIHGVGLQMHMSYLVPNTGIDNALMKMAQLGLLVRITELDVSLNLGSRTDPQTANFTVSTTMYPQQAAKYKYVVESYFHNVPESQRSGITVWGVSDRDSWLRNWLPYHTRDYPLLWDDDFNKKEAYHAFISALQAGE